MIVSVYDCLVVGMFGSLRILVSDWPELLVIVVKNAHVQITYSLFVTSAHLYKAYKSLISNYIFDENCKK